MKRKFLIGAAALIMIITACNNPFFPEKKEKRIIPVTLITEDTVINDENSGLSDEECDEGDELELTVSVKGDEDDYTYQWYINTEDSNKDGTPIDGATGPSFNPPTDKEGTAYYYVIVTNKKTGKTTASKPVKITVKPALEVPAINYEASALSDMEYIKNKESVLTVSVEGDEDDYSYQWYSNTVDSNEGGTQIPDATDPEFNPPTDQEGTTYYYVVVTNKKTGKTTVSKTVRVTVVGNIVILLSDTVVTINEKLEDMYELNDLIFEESKDIAKDSEDLLKINSVMSDIASLITLNSMNGAIEAAHTGEAGNGFAVLINEIRKCSESYAQQTITNEAMLKKIKASIEAITLSIGDINDDFDRTFNAMEIYQNKLDELDYSYSGNISDLYILYELFLNLSTPNEFLIKAQDISEKIKEIAKDIEGLLEINSVMNNITSQINTLSLNAAIEAAHMEAAGKGLAVVSDDIRKFSEASAQQVKTTETMLKKIKASIEAITLNIEQFLTLNQDYDLLWESINTNFEDAIN